MPVCTSCKCWEVNIRRKREEGRRKKEERKIFGVADLEYDLPPKFRVGAIHELPLL